ncbi:MAG: dockerin type I repeat-containing protein, partial [Bacteroidales bacterium]|nr:dockerin type I repeat-containing protein [Bacteroidales bacterium]
DLARQHLISAFYGWGSTGFYSHACFDENILSYSGNTHTVVTKNRAGWYQLGEEVDTDWEGVQAYLDVHYPQYDVKSYENEYQADYPCYRISGTEDLSLRECLELAGELYEHFGITVNYAIPENAAEPTLGHNALERAGDVTLDCELDIMDVIAANKYILGVGTLCDTAKKPADVSGDGTPDAADTLAILKEVTGVTTDFAEP